jgi:hypothetical protein
LLILHAGTGKEPVFGTGGDPNAVAYEDDRPEPRNEMSRISFAKKKKLAAAASTTTTRAKIRAAFMAAVVPAEHETWLPTSRSFAQQEKW